MLDFVNANPVLAGAAALAACVLAFLAASRFRAWFVLRRAKHPSLKGHPRLALRLARLVPQYSVPSESFAASDGAPAEIAERRKRGFDALSKLLRARAPRTLALSAEVEDEVSDVAFTNAYRVPFQYRDHVRSRLPVGCFVEESQGVRIRDLDGNWSYDLSGAYGMNLLGYDVYKDCIEKGAERVRDLGPFLGAYHPVLADNVRRLREISGLDEVSFHMSGTEAVMQAVRLACYHTRRTHVVRFCGAYHGWWDGVQPGPGNPRVAREVFTLRDMDERSLRVLRTRKDVACVLVNPLQAMHPNAAAPSDSMLVSGSKAARFDRAAYSEWLRRLRATCTEKGIVLVFDEVFLGFRLARGGAQEYFGVRADLVTYGKTVGGGLPIGVVCGKRELMKRYRDDRPSDVCFARGTFNSHPYVMGAMNEFLRRLDRPEVLRTYEGIDETWNARAAALNVRLAAEDAPVRVANLTSVFTVAYTRPGRFHWMLQYYLRAQGLVLPWIGTGRLIFGHDYTDADFEAVADRFVAAAAAMRDDGWWWQDAALTNASIRRRVTRELLAAAFRRGKRTSASEATTPSPGAPTVPAPATHR
jgi:glutamate-1-semialdehyde 2,1-aminomutase